MAQRLLLYALLLWPLAAFGGRSASTAKAFGTLALLTALVIGVRLGGAVDRAVLTIGGLLLLQLVPLPRAVVGWISPHASGARDALALLDTPPGAALPLSLDPGATLWALAVFAGAAAVYWIARVQFERGGIRTVTRFVAAVGAGMSLLAVAQAATAGRNIYWLFPTDVEGPLPFGPFVNRNHFGTWIILALPLCLSYLAARSAVRRQNPMHAAPRTRLARIVDPRSAWLITASGMMLTALLLSLSRSAALSLMAAVGATILLTARRRDQPERRGGLLVLAMVALLGVMWADLPALSARFSAAPSAVVNRVQIWRETVPLIRDFWVTGTGGGTYQHAMNVYQRSDRTAFYNQAHNHYLQLAAEGGLLLIAAVAMAVLAFLRLARERMVHEPTGLIWIRSGAACGLGAAALQSLWETGLTMPANAALAAVLAAMVTCVRSPLSCPGNDSSQVQPR